MVGTPAFTDQDLAKQSQNLIGNMISVPMQNNAYVKYLLKVSTGKSTEYTIART